MIGNRLALVVVLAMAIPCALFAAETQQAGKVHRIGFLRFGQLPPTYIEGFRQGLRELGYIEGQNITIEYGLAQSTAQLSEVAGELIRQQVDVVDIFRRPDAALEAVRAAIQKKDRLGIKTVWMQIGVVNEAAAAEARAAGLAVVMDRCPKIEYARLLGA